MMRTLPLLIWLAVGLILPIFASAQGANTPVIASLASGDPCIEDTPCYFTLVATDPDPGDIIAFTVTSTINAVHGALHQYDGSNAPTFAGLVVNSGDLVTDPGRQIVLIPNANYSTQGKTAGFLPQFAFEAVETNVPGAIPSSVVTPEFSISPTDDAPVSGDNDHPAAFNFPNGASNAVTLVPVVTPQVDIPADSLALTFTLLPIAVAGQGEVRVGSATGPPAVLGVEYICAPLVFTCADQFFYVADSGETFPSNTVIASIGYTIRDVAAAAGVSYAGAGFLGLTSPTEGTLTVTTASDQAMRFVGVLSGPAAYGEGVFATTEDVVIRFAQPESGMATAPFLAVTGYPTSNSAGDNDPRVYTSGVVFPSTAARTGVFAAQTYFSGQTDCSPLVSCAPLLQPNGASYIPNLRYAGVCDANFCDFTLSMRACTPAEVVDGCDPDYSGTATFPYLVSTQEAGITTIGTLDFTVNSDQQEVRIDVQPACSIQDPTELSYQLATEGPGFPVHIFDSTFCMEVDFLSILNGVAMQWDMFEIEPFNDGLDEATTTWRADIQYFTGCSGGGPTCIPLEAGVNGLGSAVLSTELSLMNPTSTPATVSADPAVNDATQTNTLQIFGTDLLTLRQALFEGLRLVATIDPAALTGGTTLLQSGDAVIVTLHADQGAGFTEVARSAMFILLNAASGNAPQGPPVEYCGDMVLQPAIGEQCDDGNVANGDGCSNVCTIEVCGDGVLQTAIGEFCDDGNLVGGDGCSSTCTVEQCGNGLQDVGEQCDDGNLVSGDGCDQFCAAEYCGDGIAQPSEGCDDGNFAYGDGCNAFCAVEICGNGTLDFGEQCDDGNLLDNDGCTQFCVVEFCGDGIRQSLEQCDDGNTHSGDGCSASCTLEGVAPVPTLGDRGGLILALVLLATGVGVFVRRNRVAGAH